METLREIFTVTLPTWFAAAFQWIVSAFEALWIRFQIEAIQGLEGFIVGLDLGSISQNIESAINNFGPSTIWIAYQLKVPEMMAVAATALGARVVMLGIRAIL